MLFYTLLLLVSFFFFFNDTATTEIYTLSLHDALPISPGGHTAGAVVVGPRDADVLPQPVAGGVEVDRGRATPGAGVVGQPLDRRHGRPLAATDLVVVDERRAGPVREIGRASCRERV